MTKILHSKKRIPVDVFMTKHFGTALAACKTNDVRDVFHCCVDLAKQGKVDIWLRSDGQYLFSATHFRLRVLRKNTETQ